MSKGWRRVLAGIGLLLAPWVQAGERLMAVTIDDLPFVSVPSDDPAALRAMTDGLTGCLRARGIPAVGFVNEGRLVRDGAPDPGRIALLQAWLDAGFELGNHTYGHVSLNKVPFETYAHDVVRGEAVTRPLAAAAGRPLRWFRPPFLDLGRTPAVRASLQRLLDERGYVMSPVTVNSSEWVFADAYRQAVAAGDAAAGERIATAYVDYMLAVVADAERQALDLVGRPIRHVLLLHANALNADRFCALAEALEARGYRFTSLASALEDPVYARALPATEWDGFDWLARWSRGAGLPRRRQVPVPAFVREWTQPAARAVGAPPAIAGSQGADR